MAHPEELAKLGTIIFTLVITLIVLTWIAVSLRMWVRLFITRSPGWDDASIIGALCLFTCYCAFILVLIMASAADKKVTLQGIVQDLVFIKLSEIFYILTTTFLKISLGLFFLRLLTKPWQTLLFQTILTISAAYGTFYVLITIFACGNPAKLGAHLLGDRTLHCAPAWFILSTGYIYGICNVLADWIFTLIPIVILLDSQMDKREKISVGIVMTFAAVGSISSIMRMVYLKGLMFEGTISANTIKATIWATAEPGTGIVAASAPMLRPLLRKIYGDVRGKLLDYSTTKSSQHKPTIHGKSRDDTESVMELTSAQAMRFDDAELPRKSRESSDLSDPWSHRMSTEPARVGVGRAVVITAGHNVRTIPVPKRFGNS